MTEHAITALGQIARMGEPGFVSTSSIAATAGIPRPILTKVIAALARGNLVKTREGRHGGVRLARPAEEILIRHVVSVFDGVEVLPPCPIHERGCNCKNRTPCKLHDLWGGIRDAADRFLDGVTIADVSEGLDR